MLAEARRRGIVEITIRNPLEDHADLSRRLVAEFGLKRCVVVPTSIRETDVLIDLTASRAAEIFDDEARSGDTVGVAWGRTCHAFMDHYAARGFLHGMQVIPMIGGSNRTMQRYQLNEMVRIFAEKLQATPAFIHAPALAASREDYELYMGSSTMRAVMDLWSRIDVAVLSVGAPPVSQEFDGSPLLVPRSSSAADQLPIGDLCARYFDVRGRFVEDELSGRILGIPLESLKRIPKILCVVGGLEKAYSLLGALRTRIITILVTDETTATAVLSAHREAEDGTLSRSISRLFEQGAARSQAPLHGGTRGA